MVDRNLTGLDRRIVVICERQRNVALVPACKGAPPPVARLPDADRQRDSENTPEGARTLRVSQVRPAAADGRVAMFELKLLSQEAYPGALAKAERYRLLNQPWEAECIYRDVLQVDPDNQEAADRARPGDHRPVRAGIDGQSSTRPRGAAAASATSTSGPTTQGSSASAGPGCCCTRRRPGAAAMALRATCARQGWYEQAEALRRPATTMSCCAGTPAPGS